MTAGLLGLVLTAATPGGAPPAACPVAPACGTAGICTLAPHQPEPPPPQRRSDLRLRAWYEEDERPSGHGKTCGDDRRVERLLLPITRDCSLPSRLASPAAPPLIYTLCTLLL